MGICVELDAIRKQGQFEYLNIYLGDGRSRRSLEYTKKEAVVTFSARGRESLVILVAPCLCFYLCSDLLMGWSCFYLVP